MTKNLFVSTALAVALSCALPAYSQAAESVPSWLTDEATNTDTTIQKGNHIYTELFEQPTLTNVIGNFYNPTADKKPVPTGSFNLSLWPSPDPFTSNGELVPTTWQAGIKTGFYPTRASTQLGFRDAYGTSTVQIEGDTVGAYINSADYPNGSNYDKMMITPGISFGAANGVPVFATEESALVVSTQIQIPTAYAAGTGPLSKSYATFDLCFVDPNGNRISYGTSLLIYNYPPHPETVNFDDPSQSIMINGSLTPANSRITMLTGTTESQSLPWSGWKHFRFAVTHNEFQAALQDMQKVYPSKNASTNPADWKFEGFHLNAELLFGTGPAQLGWSMRHTKITLVTQNTSP